MTNTVLEKKGSIHPSAVIHPSAEIGEGVIIGPNVVIGEGVKLGNGTRVIANAYIEFAEIGENCTISHSQLSVQNLRIWVTKASLQKLLSETKQLLKKT